MRLGLQVELLQDKFFNLLLFLYVLVGLTLYIILKELKFKLKTLIKQSKVLLSSSFEGVILLQQIL